MASGKKIQAPAALLRFKALLLADRRKLVVLCVLLTLALVLTVRLLLGRTLPRRAMAAPAAAAAAKKPAAKTPESASPLPQSLSGVDTRITRDLFSACLESYPLVATAQESAPMVSMAHLQLQSIVNGPRPTAIINGVVVGVGEAVMERVGEHLTDTGYVVSSIQDQACVVTQQGVTVRLEMKQR
jgi:hypothetical protein